MHLVHLLDWQLCLSGMMILVNDQWEGLLILWIALGDTNMSL